MYTYEYAVVATYDSEIVVGCRCIFPLLCSGRVGIRSCIVRECLPMQGQSEKAYYDAVVRLVVWGGVRVRAIVGALVDEASMVGAGARP